MPEGAVRRLHDRGGPGQQEEAQDKLLLPRLQKHMAGYKLLIIDELGFVPLSKTGSELLFEPISQRYERRATFIASRLQKIHAVHLLHDRHQIFELALRPLIPPIYCFVALAT